MDPQPDEPHEPLQEELEDLANSLRHNEQPSESEPDDDERPSDDIPEHIAQLLEDNGIFVPEGVSRATREEIYTPMLNGRCMACKGELARDTIIVITKHGITMVFCGGACLSDYNVVGWLSTTYDDIMQQMNFRGGQGGN
jgi:hypothetical protein